MTQNKVDVFFFNDTATTEIYTLSLHDALPIFRLAGGVVHVPEHLDDAVVRLGARVGEEHLAHRRRRALDQHLREVHHRLDRKSTRLNSSHANISYAVFCLKKKICLCLRASLSL